MAAVLPRAQAFSFRSDSGDWAGSWDTTIGYGMGWRVSNPDCRLIAIANGGCGYSPNIDDGDLNYLHKAEYTKALTGVTELQLKYKEQFGAFVRASGLYDFSVMGNDVDRTPLSHEAKGVVGSYTRLLDAFGFLRFDLGSLPSELRVGRQVVSWARAPSFRADSTRSTISMLPRCRSRGRSSSRRCCRTPWWCSIRSCRRT